MTDVYYTITKNQKDLVTLLHGLGEDSTIMNWQVQFLQNYHFSTLTIDLRGHGRTPLREKVSVQSHTIDLAEVLDQERTQKTHLIGFSLGAAVALEFAYRNPDLVDRLVLINPGLYHRDFMTWNVKILYPFLPLLGKIANLDLKVRANPDDLSKALFSTAYYSLPNGLKNTSLNGLYQNIVAFMEYGIPDYLDQIKQETLIIRSDVDELIREGASDLIHEKLKNSSKLLVKGNHAVILSNPEEINKKIIKFLGDDQPT